MTRVSTNVIPAQWTRSTPFEPAASAIEMWNAHFGSEIKSFPVESQYGKPLNALSLKSKVLQDFEKHLAEIRDKNQALFSDSENLEAVARCPICQVSSENAELAASFYGGSYYRCPTCFHFYIRQRPTAAALKKFYQNDATYQATYADKDLIATRMNQVAYPKTDWVLNRYRAQYGREPKSLLDIGAGSGHMVKAARDRGLRADGIELSQSGIAFAKLNFEIDLFGHDFLAGHPAIKNYDIITFWGVLEHVVNPIEMLNAANRHLEPGSGMLIAEVPRWHCLTTEVQKQFPEKVVRHLDPSSHIHIFSDSSLATSFLMTGLAPSAAWYFGLDVYELVMQLLHAHGGAIEKAAPYLSSFQSLCDQNRYCDFLILAGTPFPSK